MKIKPEQSISQDVSFYPQLIKINEKKSGLFIGSGKTRGGFPCKNLKLVAKARSNCLIGACRLCEVGVFLPSSENTEIDFITEILKATS